MSICLRYGSNYDHAVEIVNDGFLKIFNKIGMYNPKRSFRGWLRRIMINSAIDHYRKEVKHETNRQSGEYLQQVSQNESITPKMAYDEVILQIQKLSPSYRAVFNLYVIDGYKHREISKILKISVGTSKSNLSRARNQLQAALKQIFKDELA